MNDVRIIAVFDTLRHAQTAADDLLVNDIRPDNVTLYTHHESRQPHESIHPDYEMHRRTSFWSWLVGDRHRDGSDFDALHFRYDCAIDFGTAIVVAYPDARRSIADIRLILSSHGPRDLITTDTDEAIAVPALLDVANAISMDKGPTTVMDGMLYANGLATPASPDVSRSV